MKRRHKICIDQNVKSNFTGFEKLISYYHDMKESPYDNILLDFANVKMFDSNLFAVLAAECDYFSGQNKKIVLRNLPQHLRIKLDQRHKLAQQLTVDEIISLFEQQTDISYCEFQCDQGIIFSKYVDHKILNDKHIPAMSKKLKMKINDSFGEVFANVGMHANAEKTFCAGQIFESTKRLDFSIVDLGTTIYDNVTSYLEENTINSNCKHAIEWAVQEGNSTKTTTGGFGLSVLSEFVALNSGKLHIVSANEYWELFDQKGQKKVRKKFFKKSFPGTIVNVEVNLDDNMYYQLKDEDNDINESDIF